MHRETVIRVFGAERTIRTEQTGTAALAAMDPPPVDSPIASHVARRSAEPPRRPSSKHEQEGTAADEQ